jgi:hypothetical protein
MSTLDNPVMENPNPVSPWSVALPVGGIGALLLIVLGLITYLLGYTDPARGREPLAMILSLLSFVIWIGAMVIAVRQVRSEQDNIISFGAAFKTAFFALVVMAVISLVWSFVLTNVIAPDFYNDLLDGMRAAMEDQGAPEESIDMMMGIYEKIFSPVLGPIVSLASSLIGGAIVSLIVGAIMKKDAPQT